MALIGMADNNIEIPAKRDGAMYNSFAGNKDYIIAGIGDEFEIESSSTSFVLTLGTGEAVICGRHVVETLENDSATMIQLDANSSGYVVVRFDLTRPSGSEVYLTTVQVLLRQDLNGNGTICDLPLYEYVTGDSGVTSFIDMRNVSQSSTSGQTLQVTLAAANWQSDIYTITNSLIKTSGNITLTYPLTITEEEYDELTSAAIRPYALTDGTLTLKANGGAPSIDIPIEIVMW